MLTIKYIPNILSKNGRKSVTLEHSPDLTIDDYLARAGWVSDGMKAIVAGKAVRKFDRGVHDGDEIIITPDVQFDPGTWVAIWGIFQVVSAIVAVAAVGYSIYQAITYRAPATPSYGSTSVDGGDNLDASSPTYGWEGVQTTQEVGRPLGIVYGEHKIGGNVINSYISTDGDKNYLNVLLGLCEGEIDSIADIQINDNPIANYDGIDTYERYGTNTDTIIQGFEDLHDEKSVSVQLTKNNSYVYTTVGTDVQAFQILLRLPNGLFYTDSSNGSVNAWQVTYQVEYKLHTDVSYTDLGTVTIDTKSRSVVRRYFNKYGLTAGQYDIRVTKTSDDGDFYHIGDLYWHTIDEITSDDLTYPNTAKLGIKALASEQLSGSIPNITCIIKGRKVSQPQIMNGGTEVAWEDYYWNTDNSEWRLLSDDTTLSWDGVTYVTKWCANPAWCLKDLLLNTRFGLGQFIDAASVNNDDFIALSKWCDEKIGDGEGGYEKRMRMDIVIDSPSRATDVFSQLASSCRGIIFYSEGALKIIADKAGDPVQLFGMGNIIEGSFSQGWKSKKDVPNVIEIQFMNKDKGYQQEQVAYIDEASLAAGDPIRKKQIRVFTTRMSQALREGRYALLQGKYVNRTVSFRAAIDAIAIQAGDIIDVSHDVPQWGASGRTQADSTTTKIKLDRSVTLEAGKSYKIRIRFADDTIEEQAITDGFGTYTEVNTDEFSQAPAAYDVYVVGISAAVVKPFRVMALQRESKNEISITAIEYNANIYDDSAVTIPDDNYSELSMAIPNVSNLKLTERLVKLADGTVEDAIDVWFDKVYDSSYVRGIKRVRIYISTDEVNWIYRGETTGIYYPIVGDIVDNLTYYVKAVTVTNDEVENSISDSPEENITIIGKSEPPSDITTFLVNQSRDRLFFGWTAVTDVDLKGYEIRYGDSWEAGDVLITDYKGNSYIELDFQEGNAQKYFIKAIDTSGNYSTNATQANVTIDNIPFTNIIEAYQEQTAWAGTKSDTSKVGDNLEIDAGHLSGTYETPVRDVGYVATFKIGINTVVVDASGDARFDDDDTTRFDDSETRRWMGDEVTGAATFEIRTSEDNVTWSDYITWQAGDYKCRYFQIRMTLTRDVVSKTIQCSEMNYYADLPDVDEIQDGEVSTAANGCDITFSKTFHEDPAINVTILTGSAFVWKSAGLDTTGVNIKLYDLSGTLQTGTFRIAVHGV